MTYRTATHKVCYTCKIKSAWRKIVKLSLVLANSYTGVVIHKGRAY